MFRPIRTLLLLAVAFVAGVFFERGNQRETCSDLGGAYTGGLCIGAGQ